MAHPMFSRWDAKSVPLSGNLHQSLEVGLAPDNSSVNVQKDLPNPSASKPFPGMAHQFSSISWSEVCRKLIQEVSRGKGKSFGHNAENTGKVVPGPVKPLQSNAIVIFKDPMESMALQLAGDDSQLQDSNLPNGNDKEGEISRCFKRAPLEQTITLPCSLDEDTTALSNSIGYSSTTSVLKNLRSSSSVVVSKESDQKQLPDACMDPSSMHQAKHDRSQSEAISSVEMGTITLIRQSKPESLDACDAPTQKGNAGMVCMGWPGGRLAFCLVWNSRDAFHAMIRTERQALNPGMERQGCNSRDGSPRHGCAGMRPFIGLIDLARMVPFARLCFVGMVICRFSVLPM
ncbi:hypothetical protein Nepgr_025323 [Nepenthes gracilis]|uniref:Uncharacterized protein n=1 Tax=Nepenthes gracilis TaxID=150966 RepID=A0AAD3T4Y0_NEPGR|nr:hypothetical protein Nepgr_025323 [Nepenthes gracilis]